MIEITFYTIKELSMKYKISFDSHGGLILTYKLNSYQVFHDDLHWLGTKQYLLPETIDNISKYIIKTKKLQ